MKMRSAFTLVEMLVVIGIIGLLVALIVPGYMRYLDKARIKTTKLQIRQLQNAVNLFKLDQGRYPRSLDELIHRPSDAQTWPKEGGYIDSIPKDAWGHDFIYKIPGDSLPFDIISYGADNQPGGEDENRDISISSVE